MSKSMTKSKPWMCAVIVDAIGPINIGTNGTTLRIRRVGNEAIELELKPCQTTNKEDLDRAQFQVDPLFTKAQEIEDFMRERRSEDARMAEFRKKYGLKASIREAMRKK